MEFLKLLKPVQWLNGPTFVARCSLHLLSCCWEQIRSLVPVCLYLVVVQLFVVQQPIPHASSLVGGLILAWIGLVLFTEGLKWGYSHSTPNTLSLTHTLVFVSLTRAPYLWLMLNNLSFLLVIFVGKRTLIPTSFSTHTASIQTYIHTHLHTCTNITASHTHAHTHTHTHSQPQALVWVLQCCSVH